MQLEINDARAIGLLTSGKRRLPPFVLSVRRSNYALLEVDEDDAEEIVEFLDEHGIDSGADDDDDDEQKMRPLSSWK